MVLAQGLQRDLFDDVLINWGWHFDFMDLGFHGMNNRGLKITSLWYQKMNFYFVLHVLKVSGLYSHSDFT